MLFGGRHALAQIAHVSREIHLFDRPGVFDGRLILFVKDGVLHGAKRQIESGIENHFASFVMKSVTGMLHKTAGFQASTRQRAWRTREPWSWQSPSRAVSASSKLSSAPSSRRTCTWRKACRCWGFARRD